jgi:hypothetical protein
VHSASRRVLAVVAVTGALIAVGCGGDDDSDESAGRDIDEAAQMKAESMLLELSDFPAGWRASAPEETEEADDFRECAGTDFSGLTITGEAEADEFAKGEAEVTSRAIIFTSEKEAEEAVDTVAKTQTTTTAEDCLGDALSGLIERQADTQADAKIEVGDIDIGEIIVKPPAVEDARAWQIAVPVEVKGLSPTLYIELVVLREGDAVATVTTQDTLDPFPAAQRDDLVEVVAQRMLPTTGAAGPAD